jgi:hypothetical protein
MTDDLVKRLRELNTFEWHARPATTKETCFAAADRIEELGAALRLIADTDPAGDQHWPGRIARFVLDGGAND